MTALIPASGTDHPMHVCFVTDDIEALVSWFSGLFGESAPQPVDAPPLEVARPCLRGVDVDGGFRQVILSWRSTEIEIVQPDDRPSTWREFLDDNGPGVHHIGFGVPDYDAAVAGLDGSGHRVEQTGAWATGRYTYLDTRSRLGTFLEVLGFDD